MTPLTTRARELAARERKLYDQRTIPAVLEELADEVERLTERAVQMLDEQDRDYNRKTNAMIERHAKTITKLRAEAANIAAQRDEAGKRAEVAEERLRAVEADLAAQLARMIETATHAAKGWEHWMTRCTAVEAELARIRAADRTSITVRTTEAAKMRKGQAI